MLRVAVPNKGILSESAILMLKEAGYTRQLMVMQASGGVMTREYIAGAPINVANPEVLKK